MQDSNEKILTVKQAATILGVTPLTLRNWDKSGKLEAGRHPINNYRVYRKEDIDRLLTEIRTNKEKRAPRPPKNQIRKLNVIHIS